MAGEIDGWPPIVQALIYLGGGVSMVLVWLMGGRKPEKPEAQDEHNKLTEALRLLDRAQTTSDIEKMRGDMVQVLGAMREAILTKIDQSNAELYRRVADVERGMARIEGQLHSRKTTG